MKAFFSTLFYSLKFALLCQVGFLLACSSEEDIQHAPDSKQNQEPQDTTVQLLDEGQAKLQLEVLVDSNLYAPVAFNEDPTQAGRYFVLEQQGRIRIIEGSRLKSKPFMDLRQELVQLNNSYDERGLLGMAFHPQFAQNGKFYLYLSAPPEDPSANNQSEVREYQMEDGQAPAVENYRLLLKINQPEGNHNGGHLLFGPNGYLYIGTGDGGGAGDRHGDRGNAQNRNNLLGKILRIDVDGGKPYAVPKSNPFVGEKGQPEIYAFGLRNPWRFSFIPDNEKIIAGDVGQNKYEEVSVIEKGGNYGWRKKEGFHAFDPDLETGPTEPPLTEYSHEVGFSVCGGFVYQGEKLPEEWKGRYIFADWNGKLFYLTDTEGTQDIHQFHFAANDPLEQGWRILVIGQDQGGELYLLMQAGSGPFDSSGILARIRPVE